MLTKTPALSPSINLPARIVGKLRIASDKILPIIPTI